MKFIKFFERILIYLMTIAIFVSLSKLYYQVQNVVIFKENDLMFWILIFVTVLMMCSYEWYIDKLASSDEKVECKNEKI